MEKTFLKKIEKKLKREKNRLIKELNVFTKKNKHVKNDFKAEFPEYGSQSDENAQEVNTYGARLFLEKDLEIDLKEINEALLKIEKGNYGNCEKCDKEIDEKRLESIPQTKFCRECCKV